MVNGYPTSSPLSPLFSLHLSPLLLYLYVISDPAVKIKSSFRIVLYLAATLCMVLNQSNSKRRGTIKKKKRKGKKG